MVKMVSNFACLQFSFALSLALGRRLGLAAEKIETMTTTMDTSRMLDNGGLGLD